MSTIPRTVGIDISKDWLDAFAVDRTHRELADKDVSRVTDTYHTWRTDEGDDSYADIPGFCKERVAG